MGRLEVHVRHGGHGPGEWAAVIALILFIMLAAAGGAAHKAHKELAGVGHDVLTAVEVTAWTVGALVMLAAAVGVTYVVIRIRGAVLAARARAVQNAAPPVVFIDQDGYARPVPPGQDRPQIEAPRPARTWPLAGWWEDIHPRTGGDGDDHRP